MSGLATKGFWAKCVKCSHCWIAAYYPLALGKFAKIVLNNSKLCPKCGARGSVVAKQDNGLLQEDTIGT